MSVLLCSQVSIGVHDCLDLTGRARPVPGCDPLCGKYPQPEGYVAACNWADDMLEEHDQRRCPGCGTWSIWEPCPPELDDRGGAT